MTAPLPGTVVLVGAGKMGGALLRGWLARGWAGRLTVVDPQPAETLVAVAKQHGVALVREAAAAAPPDALVLAIKPQMLDGAAPALAHLCGPQTLLLSILAGKTVADLSSRLPAGAVVRAMPNTPASVGHGITGAFAGTGVQASQRALATTLLEAVGAVEWLDAESLVDAVTAVSGSGPAYVFLMVECLAQAAREVGFDPARAERFARATVIGASALLAAEPGTGADELRRDVTSPGGTTAAALAILSHDDALAALMRHAVLAARDRARALAG